MTPQKAPGTPDQAQIRLLGRVTALGSDGRWLRIEVDGLSFTVEREEGTPIPRARVGDRVLVTGRMVAVGRVRLQTLHVVPRAATKRPLIGMLISVDLPRRRLVMRTDAGPRAQVPYGPKTTFVRLGRSSSAAALRFGDRLWVDREGGAPATRIEVMGASGKRFSGVGRITALDPARQQLRVQFGSQSQAVLAAKATVRSPGGTVPFKALRAGARVRVSGMERKGVISAQRVEVLPGARQRRTEATGSRP